MFKIIEFDQITGKIYSVLHDYFSCIKWKILSWNSTDGGAEFADLQFSSDCKRGTVTGEVKNVKRL